MIHLSVAQPFKYFYMKNSFKKNKTDVIKQNGFLICYFYVWDFVFALWRLKIFDCFLYEIEGSIDRLIVLLLERGSFNFVYLKFIRIKFN